MNLLDERHAILELSKGKLTTDPKKHSGEGIFFTSRMFDSFEILSGGAFFSHEYGKPQDWLLESKRENMGTAVFMRLYNHTARTTRKVFDAYASGEEFDFTKTIVPVDLVRYGNDEVRKMIDRARSGARFVTETATTQDAQEERESLGNSNYGQTIATGSRSTGAGEIIACMVFQGDLTE